MRCMQGAWLSRFPFCTLGWSHLEVTHARGHRQVGEGFENFKFAFFAKKIDLCQIYYFAKDKYVFFISLCFVFSGPIYGVGYVGV